MALIQGKIIHGLSVAGPIQRTAPINARMKMQWRRTARWEHLDRSKLEVYVLHTVRPPRISRASYSGRYLGLFSAEIRRPKTQPDPKEWELVLDLEKSVYIGSVTMVLPSEDSASFVAFEEKFPSKNEALEFLSAYLRIQGII